MITGFSTQAEAATYHPPCLSCNSTYINQSYSWGHVYGNSSDDITSVSVAPTGNAPVHATIHTNQGITIDNLPHATVQVSAITLATGQKAYKLYVYTKSAYAPNGDSGTFVFSTSGQLIGGASASTLSRLREEVVDADPAPFASIGAIPQGFWSDLEGDLRYAAAAAADAAGALALLDPATAPAAGGFIFGMGGWRLMARAAEVAC